MFFHYGFDAISTVPVDSNMDFGELEKNLKRFITDLTD
jgi:hypothetical protein